MGTKTEKIKVKGEELMAKIKAIIKEGNARKITIMGKDEKEILSFPLTVGVVGVALAPIFAAVATIAALVTDCTIAIEKRD